MGKRLVRFMERFFLDSIEDPVDKAAGFFGPEAFPQVDGFVQGHLGRNVITIAEFKGGETKQVAVNHRHSLQSPILRNPLDAPVNLFAMFQDTQDDSFGELVFPLIRRKVLLQLGQGLCGIMTGDIPMVQNLQGKLP